MAKSKKKTVEVELDIPLDLKKRIDRISELSSVSFSNIIRVIVAMKIMEIELDTNKEFNSGDNE